MNKPFDGVWSARLKLMAAFLALSAMLGLLGYVVVNASTRHLLEMDARTEARHWTEGLSRILPDMAALTTGATPSAETLSLLDLARRAGNVTSFRAYDTQGRLGLNSETFVKVPKNSQSIDTIDPDVAAAFHAGRPDTVLRLVGGKSLYSTSLVPVVEQGRTLGWIVANIDQTERMNRFNGIATRIAGAMAVLLVAASIFGFWFRNRERATFEQKLEWLAQRDHVTGLANKATFYNFAARKLQTAQGQGKRGAIILAGISNAADISQTHGEDTEDKLAIICAERLSAICSGQYDIARVGRMHFAVCVEDASDPMQIMRLAREIATRLCEKIVIHGNEIALHAHAGIALGESDGDTPQSILRSAELALQSAQQNTAPSYSFFNPEIAKDTHRKTAVQRAVTNAAANRAFRLDYQPVYNFRTGELNGFEALIRLTDPELGPVSPGEFIPIAEQMGLINEIGAWCLHQAARTASEWPAHLMVSVNLSPSQFLSGTLITDIRTALQDARFPAYRLEVEITEGTLMNDSELVLGQLRLLRDMGVAVALDDFGTGYSSLGYLWKFPFSKLKIDRSFVQALEEAANAKGVLRSIVKLGHGLGLTVTAEGIETTKQFLALRDLGCDLAQGYLLDRPAPVTDLSAIIMRNFANGLSRRSREPSQTNQSAA